MIITLNPAVGIPAFVTLLLVQGRCEGVLYRQMSFQLQNCFYLQTNFRKGDEKAFAPPCTSTWSAHSAGSPGSSQNHCPPASLPACRIGQERTSLFWSGFFLLRRSQEIQVVKSLISSEGSGESWPLIVWGHQHVFLVARPFVQDALPYISTSWYTGWRKDTHTPWEKSPAAKQAPYKHVPTVLVMISRREQFYKITELFRSENTFKIIKSNH